MNHKRTVVIAQLALSLSLPASAQTIARAPVVGVAALPAVGLSMPGNAPLAALSLGAPGLVPAGVLPLAAVPLPSVRPAVGAPSPAATRAPALAVIASREASVGLDAKAAALDHIYDESSPSSDFVAPVALPSAPAAAKARRIGKADLVSRTFHFSFSQYYGTMDYAAKLSLNADHTVKFHGIPAFGEPGGLNPSTYVLFRGEGTWALKNGKVFIRAAGRFDRVLGKGDDGVSRLKLKLVMDVSKMTPAQFHSGEFIPMTGGFEGSIFPNARANARRRPRR